MDSMFQTLMQMPLFHGVSYNKLSEIIGKHRFHFLKFSDKEKIISAGDPCTHLSTIVSGKVRVTACGQDGHLFISQTLEAPEHIAPDFLFGRTTTYPVSVVASGTCGIMQIEKKDYVEIINSDSVFLFNYLNMLSTNAQLPAEGIIALSSGDLKKRIAYWIIALTQHNGKEITLECRQRDLHSAFGVSRQSLTDALTEMKTTGMIDFSSSRIDVNDRRLLLGFLES